MLKYRIFYEFVSNLTAAGVKFVLIEYIIKAIVFHICEQTFCSVVCWNSVKLHIKIISIVYKLLFSSTYSKLSLIFFFCAWEEPVVRVGVSLMSNYFCFFFYDDIYQEMSFIEFCIDFYAKNTSYDAL